MATNSARSAAGPRIQADGFGGDAAAVREAVSFEFIWRRRRPRVVFRDQLHVTESISCSDLSQPDDRKCMTVSLAEGRPVGDTYVAVSGKIRLIEQQLRARLVRFGHRRLGPCAVQERIGGQQ